MIFMKYGRCLVKRIILKFLKKLTIGGLFMRAHPRHFCGVARVSRSLLRLSRALAL